MNQNSTDFVIDNGKYWHGSNCRPYTPRNVTKSSLPSSAVLAYAFDVKKVSREYRQIVCGLQNHGGVNRGSWSIKNRKGAFNYSFYQFPVMIQPPGTRTGPKGSSTVLAESEMLSYLLGFERNFFGQPEQEYDLSSVPEQGLLWEMSFDIDDRLIEERRVSRYTLSKNIGPYPSTPDKPVVWNSYSWDKRSPVVEEQSGLALDPFRHEREMLKFLADAARSQWPHQEGLKASQFLIPKFVQNHSGRYRVAVSHKLLKAGVGVYYVGIDFSTWVDFLREFDYPLEFVRRIEDNRVRLEHQLFDVAVMYEEVGAKVVPARTAVYGTY